MRSISTSLPGSRNAAKGAEVVLDSTHFHKCPAMEGKDTRLTSLLVEDEVKDGVRYHGLSKAT